MAKVLVLVPFAFDEKGVANREGQLATVRMGPNIDFTYRAVKAGPTDYDTYHDWLLADLGMLEAGMAAQEEGFDAVCSDTMSDSGVAALRSVLDIPVIGPGKASYLTALMLGRNFGILSQWDPWNAIFVKSLAEYGLTDKCVSIRSINTPPDVENLLGGKEAVVFPKLLAAGRQLVEDGADVICLGSTTMYQAHAFLTESLEVPVINPGALTYKLCDLMLGLGLTHSRSAYMKQRMPKLTMIQAMLVAGAEVGPDQ